MAYGSAMIGLDGFKGTSDDDYDLGRDDGK